jgi:mono/diheme cytochrome c family protein
MSRKSSLITIGLVLLAGVVLLTVIALFLETNPPITQEPAWDSPQTRALAQRACFDCHSNETIWPIYAKLPVGSWIAVFDTLRGRRNLNFSEWRTGARSREVGEQIQQGSMPPALYTMMHPTAILNAQEKQQLIQGLQNSLK